MMLIPAIVTGVCIGLIFRVAAKSNIPFWRFAGTIVPAGGGAALAVLIFYRAGMNGLGGAMMAAGALGVSAVLADFILFSIISVIKRWAEQGVKRPAQNNFNIIAPDTDTYQKILAATMGVENQLTAGNDTNVKAMIAPSTKEEE